ncbi:hypothetical protein J5X84_36435 [Streptosporangiaceae bacterium NEAU-GS5]|nr:hypothetical protein [Streptosporangiaceae bacterium NEAU-GS5]
MEGEEANWLRLADHDAPLQVRLDERTGPDNLITLQMRNANVDQYTGWLTRRAIVGNKAGTIEQIEGYLVNYDEIYGSPLTYAQDESKWSWSGRTQIEVDGWRIILDSPPQLSVLIRGLKESGGYGRTHALQINRIDGSGFTANDADPIMEGLHLSLSFLLGRFAAPIYSGYHVDGSLAWEEWGTPRADQFTTGHSGPWAPTSVQSFSDMASSLLSGYMDNSRAFTSKYLMQSYLAANGNGFLEQRVLIAFAGIEHLAWIRLVSEQGGDPQKINSKNADWRIRQILTQASASIEVPPHLPALKVRPSAQHRCA